MFEVVAKSGAKLAVAAVLSVTGAGIMASHSSEVRSDTSSTVDARSDALRQSLGDDRAKVEDRVSAGIQAASEVNRPTPARAPDPTPAPEPAPEPQPQPQPQPEPHRTGVDISVDLQGNSRLSAGGGTAGVGTSGSGAGVINVSTGL